MAMIDIFSLNGRQVREAFDGAARQDKRYLLLLDEVVTDVMMVTIRETAYAASSEAEIVDYLRERQTSMRETRLKAVYDTQKPFAQQEGPNCADTLGWNLSWAARQTIKADLEFHRATLAWRDLPWIQRVFTPAPVANPRRPIL